MDKTERPDAEIQYNEENCSKFQYKLKWLKKFNSPSLDLVDKMVPSREKNPLRSYK